MGMLYLVRHGQASFGAANYDQLSDLGQRQCQRLGKYFRDRGQRFDAVVRGSDWSFGDDYFCFALSLR